MSLMSGATNEISFKFIPLKAGKRETIIHVIGKQCVYVLFTFLRQ